MTKQFRPGVTLSGAGASGEHVRSLKGPSNSYVNGGADHVFETDGQGKIIRDITPQRVKVRKEHKAPDGKIFDEMVKTGTPNAADLAILRSMGILK